MRANASSAAWSGCCSQKRAAPARGIENQNEPITSAGTRSFVVDEVVRVPLKNEPPVLLRDHAVKNTDAQRRVAVEDDIADVGLASAAHQNEVAAAESRLHARAFDDRVARRAAELRRREEQPRGTGEHEPGDDVGR